MNFKLGIKESSAALAFICLPQLILYYINEGINCSNSGFMISFIICSVISLLLIMLSKKYLVFSSEKTSRKMNFIFLMFIISTAIYNLSLCLNALMSVCGDKITPELLLLILLLTAGSGAYLGAEALSRTALISFFMTVLIFVFICFISFDGWDINNLYPVLGVSPESAFLQFKPIGIYGGLTALFAIKDNIAKGSVYSAVKRAFCIIFALGLVCAFLCIITTPYPLGSLYDFSLAGIFSIARSGSFFHRFEIILVFLLILLSFNSLSFSLCLSSNVLAKFTSTNDTGPFVLLVSAFLFYALLKPELSEWSFIISNFFAALLTFIFIIVRKNKRKAGEDL